EPVEIPLGFGCVDDRYQDLAGGGILEYPGRVCQARPVGRVEGVPGQIPETMLAGDLPPFSLVFVRIDLSPLREGDEPPPPLHLVERDSHHVQVFEYAGHVDVPTPG